MDFSVKDVVWAKVKNYPWWPAEIAKLPDEKSTNVKVSFFGEQTFAMLEQENIKNYSEHYQEYTKRKTKKIMSAIELADEHLRKRTETQQKQKQRKNKRKKAKESQHDPSEEMENEAEVQEKKQESQMESEQIQNEPLKQNEITINREKIEQIETELQNMISHLQVQKSSEWKYQKYFNSFKVDALNCQELLQSNITKMLKFITIKMEQLKINPQHISRVNNISQHLKEKIMNYLTNTLYYDQYLKLIQKNKQNRHQIQQQIIKLIKKQYNNKVKKEFLQLFASLIGEQIYNGNFQHQQFLCDIKEKRYEICHEITSKAGTQRFADQIIKIYQ